MKVGVNALFYIPGEVGGTEVYLRHTLRAMLDADGTHEWVIFTNRENHATLAEDVGACPRVRLEPLAVQAGRRAARIIREQAELPRLARRHGLDVLWSPGYTMPLRCPCPRLTVVHDLQYRRFPEDLTPLALQTTRLLVGAACRWSEHLATISAFSRGELQELAGVPAARIDVTPAAPNPVLLRPLPRDESLARATAAAGGPEPFLLCVSNSYPHKRLDVAVTAFGRLLERLPHRLVIVGQPRLGEPALQRAIGRLPRHDRVVRLHRVSDADLGALYQASDALIFPSLYEGFGLPVVEALASGLPVAAMHAGAVPEVGGNAALYVQPGPAAAERLAETVLSLLEAPAAERDARAAAGRAQAARFTWPAAARATLEALARTASPNR